MFFLKYFKDFHLDFFLQWFLRKLFHRFFSHSPFWGVFRSSFLALSQGFTVLLFYGFLPELLTDFSHESPGFFPETATRILSEMLPKTLSECFHKFFSKIKNERILIEISFKSSWICVCRNFVKVFLLYTLYQELLSDFSQDSPNFYWDIFWICSKGLFFQGYLSEILQRFSSKVFWKDFAKLKKKVFPVFSGVKENSFHHFFRHSSRKSSMYCSGFFPDIFPGTLTWLSENVFG